MSKTAQRKRSLYDQGYKDAKTTQWFRWKKHPHIKSYREGFDRGIREKELERVPSWVMAILALASR